MKKWRKQKMQDENSTSTSQLRFEEELAEGLISTINDAAERLKSLMNDVEKNKGAITKLFDKVDGKNAKNAETLWQFSQVIMQVAVEKLVKETISEIERNGGNCKDAFDNAAKQLGFDVKIIKYEG